MSQAALESVASWNRFWFTPQNPQRVGILRVCVGVLVAIKFLVLWFVASEWIGNSGWLNPNATRYLIGDGTEGTGSAYRWSFLYSFPGLTSPLAVLGLVASLLLTLGLGSRVAPAIAWFALAMFHHRMPMLISIAEPLMSAMLFYLIIDPGRTPWDLKPGLSSGPARVSANIAERLIQCHLVIWLIFSLATMLSFQSWWNGEAVAGLLETSSWQMKTAGTWEWLTQILTHFIILFQIIALACIPSESWCWLGRWMLYLFAASMLLLANDWMYAAILLVASLSLWPVSIPFGKVSHVEPR